ncbi:hypothetical protein H4Q32_024835 [Labeo rohita]|uniref:Reverse transcriptase domain-containing protein n=1 Tax=Labeo rohita TaxID=84645 RepID=A0ABQ8LJF5_LABRO|nr:hypothetical protein H4Q32_024835 [Labeo rohita]
MSRADDAPTGEERVAPHHTVSVSPLCPREVSLLPLPVLQGTAASSEHMSRISPPEDVAEPRGVSRTVSSAVSCRSAITGLRASSSVNTRGQPRVAGLRSRLFSSVEATAKCVCMGPAYCRSRDLSEEGGHRGGPSSSQGVRVLQPQVVSQIRSKDAYFHVSILPQHRKFLRFAFRGEAYQYEVLLFGLALSPRMFTKCVVRILNYIDGWLILAASESLAARHRDAILAHMEMLGLRLNVKKSVLSPLQRTTYLDVVWNSTTMQARLSPAWIESILTADTRVKEVRALTVKQFQQQLGLMAAASNMIPFGLLYMSTLHWWLKTRGFSPRGNPLHMIKVTQRCLRALDMWRNPWFLNQGPVLGALCRRITLATDASLTGWGGGHEWPFCPRPERSPCAGVHRQHSSGLLYQPPGRSAFAPLIQAGAPDPLPVSSSYSWASECGSRRPVEAGAEAWGMDGSPRVGEADTEILSSSSSGFLCHEGECSMFLSSSSSSPRAGCHGTDVAEATFVHFSPDRSAPGSSGESPPGWVQFTVSSPVLAGLSMVLGPHISPRRLSMGDSRQEASPLTVQSSLYEETVRPEVEAFHFMVWRTPAFLTIKTALLLALTSLKWVGDLQALSVASSHLEFAPGMTKAFLYPRPGYVPKVPTNTPQPVVLQAFCPPPFREPDQQKQNCMCPVRALDAYVHRAALWRKTDQLFVCYVPPKKGYPATKQTLSRWTVDAISTAYESSDLPSPLGVKARLALWLPPKPLCQRLRTQLEFLKGNVPGYGCNHGSPRERDAASRSILPASLPSARFIPRS